MYGKHYKRLTATKKSDSIYKSAMTENAGISCTEIEAVAGSFFSKNRMRPLPSRSKEMCFRFARVKCKMSNHQGGTV